MLSPEKFQRDTFSALNNPQLRRNFKMAMTGLMEKRQDVFPDAEEWQLLRELGSLIRANALRISAMVSSGKLSAKFTPPISAPKAPAIGSTVTKW